MIKKTVFVVFLGAFVFFSSPLFAYSSNVSCHGKEHCGKMEKGKSQCPITNKFMKKAHFLLEHKSDIALTEDQVKTIKELKLQMEKDSVRQGADMQTFMLDLDSKLSGDTVDVEGTSALIDKTFTSFSASAKTSVEAYAKLKGLLTPDQVTKMKAIHEQMEKKEEAEENERK